MLLVAVNVGVAAEPQERDALFWMKKERGEEESRELKKSRGMSNRLCEKKLDPDLFRSFVHFFSLSHVLSFVMGPLDAVACIHRTLSIIDL